MYKYQISVKSPITNSIKWVNCLNNKERQINEFVRINPSYKHEITQGIEEMKEREITQEIEITQGIEEMKETEITQGIEEMKEMEITQEIEEMKETEITQEIEITQGIEKLSLVGLCKVLICDINLYLNEWKKKYICFKYKFNNEQLNCINLIKNYILNNNDEYISFTGAAGTGKSFTILGMFNLFKNEFKSFRIGFVGPTNIIVNKCQEIKEQIKNNFKKINFYTVSQLLNEKVVFDNYGNKTFKNTSKKHNIYNNDILIFDESSMIETIKINNILKLITDYKNKKNKNILCIFVGDKNQLNPINENENFILQNSTINLTENMRCDKRSLNSIFNIIINEINNYTLQYNYVNFEQFIIKLNRELLNNTNDDIIVLSDKTKFLKLYIDTYKNEESLITSYTNNCCNLLNTEIKDLINDKDIIDRFYKGQQIIFMNRYKVDNIIWNTSEIAFITNLKKKHYNCNIVNIQEFTYYLSNNKTENINDCDILQMYKKEFNNIIKNLEDIFKLCNKCLKYKNIIISISNLKTKKISNINVLNSIDLNKYNNNMEQIKLKIYNLNSLYKTDKKTDLFKDLIDNLFKFLSKTRIDIFAEINDGYCMTVHKIQGISIDNIFVNLEDILSMIDFKNKLKCIYTSFTRCSKKLIVLTRYDRICKCGTFCNKYTKDNIDYWKHEKCKYYKWSDNSKCISCSKMCDINFLSKYNTCFNCIKII